MYARILTATCPSCEKHGSFTFAGVQHYSDKYYLLDPKRFADKALYTCAACGSTFAETSLKDVPTAEELIAYFEALPDRRAAADDDKQPAYRRYSNRGKDSPRSRWEARQVAVSSAGAKVLATRRTK